MSSWQYKLFFSVDLENSTGYKSASSTTEELFAWSKKFEAFYEAFDGAFLKACKEYRNLPKPPIWKLVGDEILYQCNIKDSASVKKYVTSLQQAIKSYNKEEAEKNNDGSLPMLLCKGTVWGAGFPIRNRIIKTPLNQEDYLGIDIDIGFRLTKHSSSDKIAISLPVAYILALHDYDGLRYYDKQMLKGVDGLYPIFWISSMYKAYPESNWENSCNYNTVVDYCNNLFTEDFSKPFIKPFIHNDRSKKCREISQKAKDLKAKNDKLESAFGYTDVDYTTKARLSRRKFGPTKDFNNFRMNLLKSVRILGSSKR